MDDAAWTYRVRRLGYKAEKHPIRYRRKVALLAVLGYVFLAALVLVLLGLLAADIYSGSSSNLWFLVLYVPLLVGVIDSFSIRLGVPEGVHLTREEMPELFAEIDQVNAAVQGPALESVLLDGRLNAGVVQIPRRSLIGSRNYLVLGLPLLEALPPAEFRGVLAHELAHLSRMHGRLRVWVFRVRVTWEQVFVSVRRARHLLIFLATLPVRWFVLWYVPCLDAHTLPLMRVHEFEADRLAAGVVGAETLACGLSRIAVADGFLDEQFWPSVIARASVEVTPPPVFTELGSRIREVSASESAQLWLKNALAQRSEVTDTHPSLAERLKALGVSSPTSESSPPLEPPGTDRAADLYINSRLATLSGQLDAEWQRDVAVAWQRKVEESHQATPVESRRSGHDIEVDATQGPHSEQEVSPPYADDGPRVADIDPVMATALERIETAEQLIDAGRVRTGVSLLSSAVWRVRGDGSEDAFNRIRTLARAAETADGRVQKQARRIIEIADQQEGLSGGALGRPEASSDR